MDKLIVSISSKRAKIRAGLSELWAFRELLFFFIWRDVKVRYKQTVIGVCWAVLQPLFAMVVFSIVFGLSLIHISEPHET